MFKIILGSLLVSICITSGAFTEQTHPFSVHDLLTMDRISDPQVSPDGNWIVFVLQQIDLEANV